MNWSQEQQAISKFRLAVFDVNSKGQFEIHDADCTDCVKVRTRTGLNFTVSEYSTAIEVSEDIWQDMIAEGSMTAEEGLADLDFKPCVKIPARPIQHTTNQKVTSPGTAVPGSKNSDIQAKPEIKQEKPVVAIETPKQVESIPALIKVAHELNMSERQPTITAIAPAGMISRQVGDIILRNGAEWVVVMANDCRARIVKVNSPSEDDGINSCCEPSEVIRRMAKDEVKNLLLGNARPGGKQKTTTGEGKNQMSKKSKVQEEKPQVQAATPEQMGTAPAPKAPARKPKAEKAPVEKTERISTVGRPDWVRGLKAAKTPKAEAFKQFAEKYRWGTDKAKEYFNAIWDGKPKAAKAEAAAPATPAAKAPARPKKAKAAPAAATPPPRKMAAQVAAEPEPQPETAAAA
jgi:hypothetical protein